MRKMEITTRIANSANEYCSKGCTPMRTKKIVQMFIDKMIEVIKKEGRLELRRFGVFYVKTQKRKTGYHFKKKCITDIPEKKVIKFKQSSKLKLI